MTSSFVKILANHKGPWKLRVMRKADAKGRPRGAWSKEKTDDPVGTAFRLMEAGGEDVIGVNVWSESEQQFALSIVPGDRATWEAEAEGWRDKIKAVLAEVKRALPKAAVTVPAGVNDATRARVMRLRLEGMTYMQIEEEILGEAKKGFWAWRIVKAAERAAEEAAKGAGG